MSPAVPRRTKISEMGMHDRLRYVGPRPWSEFRTKCCNFEDDALANGKIMKLIPEHMRDVVKFPYCVRDQPAHGLRVANGLQPSQDSIRGYIIRQ